MALHELATNAVKHGALSNDVGTVDIGWVRKCNGRGDEFCMYWRETGGPPVLKPTRRGFGTTVISTLVGSKLSGDVELEYADDGFSWVLKCPATNAFDDIRLNEGRET
jgi:two-component sensor histidine kinase